MKTLPQIPGYNLQKSLGAGGMGVVYLATRDDNEFHYAIKMLLSGRNAGFQDLARFRVEAEAYSCLNHHHIVKIRDVGVANGCPYLAMDYASHGSLKSFLDATPDLDLSWRIKTIQQVADALVHAHGRRILHRDLKPANILIDASGAPKVSDFGLVKFAAPIADVSQACCTFKVTQLDLHLQQLVQENQQLLPVDDHGETLIETLTSQCAERTGLNSAEFDLEAIQSFIVDAQGNQSKPDPWNALDQMTHAGTVLGSPHFMAPEQASGRLHAISPQTDVYGLGATLYFTLTGRTPFTGRSALEVMKNLNSTPITPPHQIDPSIPEEVSLVVLKAMAREPSQRYADMAMMRDDLQRLLDGQSPLARLSVPRSRHLSASSLIQQAWSSISTFIPRKK